MKKFCVITEFLTGDTTRKWFGTEYEALDYAGNLITSRKSKVKCYVVEIKQVLEPQSQYIVREPMERDNYSSI